MFEYLDIPEDLYKLKFVLIFALGFAMASLLGYVAHRLKLSPILGFLIAGYLFGPYSPGIVMDLEVSEQLAEIGVVLMMFSVGLHFKWEDLVHVKNIAIPGALGQTFITAILGCALIYHVGWGLEAGIVIGMAIGVASTVVLVRILTDNNLLNTVQGHIAVGWLLVEDVLTVFALILLPILADVVTGKEQSLSHIIASFVLASLKFLLLAVVAYTMIRPFVKFSLLQVARTRSDELMTLTILALTFAIAILSALVFGASIALGAFIAGMVIGQTEVRHQALANSLPLKDAFVAFFFLAIGMLFNPIAIWNHFFLFLGILGIILLIKPIVAFLITVILNYPYRTALTVALALAQIGEFSFILATEASKYKILSDEGFDIIVASALVSLGVNPSMFKTLGYFSDLLERKSSTLPHHDQVLDNSPTPDVLIIGYGPTGQAIAQIMNKLSMINVIIDTNIDMIESLREDHRYAVYGDATQPNILEIAKVKQAKLMVITSPDTTISLQIIESARMLNPRIQILARVSHLADESQFKEMNVMTVCEEGETSKAMNRKILKIIYSL